MPAALRELYRSRTAFMLDMAIYPLFGLRPPQSSYSAQRDGGIDSTLYRCIFGPAADGVTSASSVSSTRSTPLPLHVSGCGMITRKVPLTLLLLGGCCSSVAIALFGLVSVPLNVAVPYSVHFASFGTHVPALQYSPCLQSPDLVQSPSGLVAHIATDHTMAWINARRIVSPSRMTDTPRPLSSPCLRPRHGSYPEPHIRRLHRVRLC